MTKFIKSALLGSAMLFAANLASADIIVTDNFSSNKGWTLDTNWQIGSTSVSPTANGNPDPAQDHSATADNGVLGAKLGSNIGAPDGMHGFYYATSQAYNLANVSKVNVSFYRWLNTDYDPYMTSQVEAFDGSAWHVIFTNCCVGGAGQIFDSAWTQQSYDVSAYADHNAAFRLRFSYDVTDAGVYTTGGWNVDDLSISGQVPEPGSLMLMGLGLAGFVARRKAKAA
jgi:hypothetical protein